MAIRNIEELRGKMKIDITGPEGNAYVLMGIARRLAKQLSKDGDAIVKEMMSNDYEHLVQVFDNHFGKYVDLYR